MTELFLHFFGVYGIICRKADSRGSQKKHKEVVRYMGRKYGRKIHMRKYKKICLAAVTAAVCLAAAGCSAKNAPSTAPRADYTELRDPVAEPDTTGAEIELLNMENPREYCYSSRNADMVFKKKDGVWVDMTDSSIPINQEKFQAMADNFLKLRAVSKVENPGDLSSYGLDRPSYTLSVADEDKGSAYIAVGNQDADGNYYATLDERNVYVIKKETVESMDFEYDPLVVRDSLDLTVTAADMKKVVIKKANRTETYKPSDTEAMTRIANGLSQLKPTIYSTFHATAQELTSAEISEGLRMELNAEFLVDGEARSITIYVGTFADAGGERRYVQLEGSQMISEVDSAIVSDLLNLTEEESTMS